jgi:hypothetical protein
MSKEPSLSPEPAITINGVPLTFGQAMTVRVAVGHFGICLSHDGLGKDAHGKKMTEGYLARIEEIDTLMGRM